MNKFFKIASLGLLSGALIFSANSYAHLQNSDSGQRKNCTQSGKWSKGESRGFAKLRYALRDLELSETQRSDVKAIMMERKPVMKSMRQAMKDSRDQLHTLMKSRDYDESAVQQAANNQASLIAQKLMLMAKTKAELFKVLTPDQQQTLIEKFESRKNR